MVESSKLEPYQACHYFVDEAGDGTLFNKKKKTIVGNEGCSSFFILGVLEVRDPKTLHESLEALRQNLLNDPYLSKIHSMRPERRKTALAFHAKDDCAEVRREVYRLLLGHEIKFFAVVRDKHEIVRKVKEHNSKHPGYRYHPNQLYDRCISRVFKEKLHKEESYVIRFSKRGNRNRTDALKKAIEQARTNLRQSWGIDSASPIEIIASKPEHSGGLQAVDYLLWALQRLYERHEDRYWEYIADKVSFIHDVDDIREAKYGTYYSKKNPLSVKKLKKIEPGI